jgi:hypothetical protein
MGVMQSTERVGYKSNPLSSTYSTYRDMFDNNIIYSYKGIVTSDLVTHVLDIMGNTLEDNSSKLSKKVSNVMVECLTNVYVDEEQLDNYGYDPTAMLMVKKMGDMYGIVTSKHIKNSEVAPMKKLLDRINSMQPSELKQYYQELLKEVDVEVVSDLSTLGIIDLARKSRNKLQYSFKFINQDYSFFSLEARIVRQAGAE